LNTYVFKFLLAFDMFVAALLWRDDDVTISSYCGLELRKADPKWWARILGGALNWIQAGHCESAITHDQDRAVVALQILGYKGQLTAPPG
jgi:hypothetical protein